VAFVIEGKDLRSASKGMEREYGATEICAFPRRLDFAPSNVAFGDTLKK
jgi:hypothetical protein